MAKISSRCFDVSADLFIPATLDVRLLFFKLLNPKLSLFFNNETKDIEVILGKKSEKGFKITPVGNPSPLQKQILEDWLKG